MKITVVGAGYVGLVTSVCLSEMGYEVTCIDVQESRIDKLQKGISPIYEPELELLLQKNIEGKRLTFTTSPEVAYRNADIIFIAVGTPQRKDGTVNVEYLYQAVNSISQHLTKDTIICTKSTVPVGTNYKIKQIINFKKPPHLRINVVANPEFLREGSAIFDFFYGDRIVIGTDHPDVAIVLEQLYQPLKIPIIKTDVKSAELIKYASNAFLATKISFINEMAALCEKVGANIDDVAFGIGKDQRIGSSFLQAGIGYGGSCFPKDINALFHTSGEVDHHFELLESVIKVNNRQQVLPISKARELLGDLKGRKVSVLGLAFKPNTDDLRESAGLRIIRELLTEGAILTAYDPVAIQNAKAIFGYKITYTTDISMAIQNADLTIIATEWEHIKQYPLELYSRYMKEPIIIDGRNCYSLEEIKKYPLHYISVGRPTVSSPLFKSNVLY